MTVSYDIYIKSRAGVLQEILTGALGNPFENQDDGYLSLSYVKGVNEVGAGAFVLNADSHMAQALCPNGVITLDMQVEFWRRDDDNEIEPYCDFYGFVRDRDYETDDNGQVNLLVHLAEQQDLLRREIVAWPHNVANRSLFTATKASTIMTNLVRYNATSDATTGNGRLRTTDLSGITYETDDDDGGVLTIACGLRNLHEVLREVGNTGNRDFWLEKAGAQAWEFRTDNYLGDNRSSSVVFSLLHGNMRRPILRSGHRTEKTVAIMGGAGTDDNRPFRIRTGANYDASDNSTVVFVNASQQITNDGIDSEGDIRLEELRARDTLSFDVIQVPSTLYGKHYFLGDIVSAYFRGFTYAPQIIRVTVDVRDRGSANPEQISIATADA